MEFPHYLNRYYQDAINTNSTAPLIDIYDEVRNLAKLGRSKELFSKYRIRVKGNISTHTFRKTLGRRVVEVNNYSNESLVLLMELFGHSNMGITKRYLGITKDEIHNVYDN
jgi:integrase